MNFFDKYTDMRILTVCLLLIAAQLANADLPIHGVLNDVKGTWSFTVSKAKSEGPAACGGGVPNFNIENLEPELENYSKWVETNSEIDKTFSLLLTDKRIAASGDVSPRNKWQKLAAVEPSNPSKVLGTWTMVYDEGFEVHHKNRKYFAFLKYSRKDSSYCPPELNGDNENNFGETKCYATDPSRIHMGWYVEEQNVAGQMKHRWGCFHAQKENSVKASPSFVLENVATPPKIFNDEFVERHNTNSASWIAEQHEQFANSTPDELRMARKQLGYKKYHSTAMSYRLPEFLQKDKSKGPYACNKQPSTSLLRSETPLPVFWSWGDPFISESWNARAEDVVNQGNCGSCYAVSSAYVLQKRFEVLLNKLFPHEDIKEFEGLSLSPQSILSCSPYNQGCDGGYPYLVGKHAREFGFPTTECMSYVASHSPSDAPCKMHMGDAKRSPQYDGPGCSKDERWYAKDYGYVGGCYECCNEEHMMREIFLHGPVVVAIDAPDQLFLYRDGVFDSPPSEHGKICDDPNKDLNGWEYTNHAVAIVGWGEEEQKTASGEPVKYWIVRNTWGKDWGKHGYLKVVRGKNFAGIESQAVYLDPDLTRGQPKQLVEKLQRRRKSRDGESKATHRTISEHTQSVVS